MVYPGWRVVVFAGCDILPVAENAFFACGMAFVCDWWDGVFLFCRTVRLYFGFLIIKKRQTPFFYWDFLLVLKMYKCHNNCVSRCSADEA